MVHTLSTLLLCGAVSYATQAVFPPAAPHYSSSFVTPKPPNITAEFRANYMQHKYDVNINNHIISGFMYMSPSLGKIRLDGADDGNFLSSSFDFTNTTANGTLVSNIVLSYTGGVTSPQCASFLSVFSHAKIL
ncbi:hypothetical protein FPV67DRAFT_1672490 [Lyophyllum atratum]|nr:hypothetical protein FPV67DRAFT_1672490 [Lyophyllum atratum]